MAAALPSVGSCCDTCDDQLSVLVPGTPGTDGDDGDDGAAGTNAFTALTSGFTVPAITATVLIQVGNSSWMVPGQKLYIQNAGYYQFVSSSSATNATVQNLGYTGNAVATTAIAVSNKVSPGGVKGTDGTNGTNAATQLTTKGDLLGFSTVDARFAVGANGTRPVADSTVALGVKYAKVNLADTAEVTGAAAIANGGTGQATANPAFNALSPVTTRGDLIVRDATVNARLPVGAVGTVLQSDGTDPVYAKITSSNINMASGPLPRVGLLGSLIGADFNSTADQAITIQSGVGRYKITKIVTDNASVSLTTAAGGLYTLAGKAGVTIVAAGQVYSALTASTKWKDLTLEAVVGTDIFTAATLFFSLTTGQGAAATGNIWIFGENLTP